MTDILGRLEYLQNSRDVWEVSALVLAEDKGGRPLFGVGTAEELAGVEVIGSEPGTGELVPDW